MVKIIKEAFSSAMKQYNMNPKFAYWILGVCILVGITGGFHSCVEKHFMKKAVLTAIETVNTTRRMDAIDYQTHQKVIADLEEHRDRAAKESAELLKQKDDEIASLKIEAEKLKADAYSNIGAPQNLSNGAYLIMKMLCSQQVFLGCSLGNCWGDVTVRAYNYPYECKEIAMENGVCSIKDDRVAEEAEESFPFNDGNPMPIEGMIMVIQGGECSLFSSTYLITTQATEGDRWATPLPVEDGLFVPEK